MEKGPYEMLVSDLSVRFWYNLWWTQILTVSWLFHYCEINWVIRQHNQSVVVWVKDGVGLKSRSRLDQSYLKVEIGLWSKVNFGQDQGWMLVKLSSKLWWVKVKARVWSSLVKVRLVSRWVSSQGHLHEVSVRCDLCGRVVQYWDLNLWLSSSLCSLFIKTSRKDELKSLQHLGSLLVHAKMTCCATGALWI